MPFLPSSPHTDPTLPLPSPSLRTSPHWRLPWSQRGTRDPHPSGHPHPVAANPRPQALTGSGNGGDVHADHAEERTTRQHAARQDMRRGGPGRMRTSIAAPAEDAAAATLTVDEATAQLPQSVKGAPNPKLDPWLRWQRMVPRLPSPMSLSSTIFMAVLDGITIKKRSSGKERRRLAS